MSDFSEISYQTINNMFQDGIYDITETNPYFRLVLATTPNMQLVVML